MNTTRENPRIYRQDSQKITFQGSADLTSRRSLNGALPLHAQKQCTARGHLGVMQWWIQISKLSCIEYFLSTGGWHAFDLRVNALTSAVMCCWCMSFPVIYQFYLSCMSDISHCSGIVRWSCCRWVRSSVFLGWRVSYCTGWQFTQPVGSGVWSSDEWFGWRCCIATRCPCLHPHKRGNLLAH